METMKFVINELNKEPFNKGLNLVSYDSLRGDQRLEIVIQVLKEIDAKFGVDSFSLSEPEEFVATLLETLRILKYTPPEDIDPSSFRQDLILGERNLITHILHWLLNKLPALKKRAYLAQFLVKIEVSPDLEGDHDILLLDQQYRKLIEDFKTTHNTYENLKKSIESVYEIQKDVKSMEEEKEQITVKFANIKRRADSNINSELFSLVQIYKREKDKNDKLGIQCQQIETEVHGLQQTLTKIQQQLKEAQSSYQLGSSPQDLLEKMEDEVKMKTHLIKEVLPSELEQLQRYVRDIEEIESQPRMGQDYLNKINIRIQTINKEINEFIERKMLNNDPMQDKLTLFRQNANVVAKKRENTAENLNTLQVQLKNYQNELNERKSGFKEGDGPLKGEALKNYITSLRERSSMYKKKRNELTEIKTESDIMLHTLEILKSKERQLVDTLVSLEEQRGISGYFSMQETTLNKIDQESSNQSVDEINAIIKRLSEEINNKKTLLAPIIKDLRPLRQQSQDLQLEYERKKQAYDACAAGLEGNVIKLENEVKQLNSQLNSLESNQYLIKCQLEVCQARQHLLDEEMKLYVAEDPDEKNDSMENKLKKEIKEQLELKEVLKHQQRQLKENEAANMKQLKMWKDLRALIEVKNKCLQQQIESKASFTSFQGRRDHLVL